MTEINADADEETRKYVLDSLVNDYLDACEAIDKHTTVKEQLSAQLVNLVGLGNRHEIAPGVGVRVQPAARRFDAKQAQAVLTTVQYEAICEPKPSSTLAAKVLPGVLVDLCKVPGGKPSVVRL